MRVKHRNLGGIPIGAFFLAATLAALLSGCGGGSSSSGGVAGLSIISVNPSSGDMVGGTTIMIKGTGFNTDTTVTIDGVDLLNPQLFLATQEITGETPLALTPGPVDVQVANSVTQETLPGGFTYFRAVTLGSITPNFGPVWGGTAVDIYGTGFVSGTSLTIGGSELQNLQVVSDTHIQGFSPAGAGGGQVDVAVTNQNGAGVIASGFEYFSPVIIFTISPNAGPTAGGTSITIRGTGFTGDSQVKVGGYPLVNTVVLNIAEITGETPQGDTFGPKDVTVTNSSGGFTFDDGFTYFDPLSIASVDPAGGPVAGGIPITIRGTGFVQGTTASLGARPINNLVVVNDLLMTGVVPTAGGPGFQDVIVVSPYGTDTLVGGFEYFDTMTVAGITPTSWFTEGGLAVTVTGTGLFPGTDVNIGGSLLVNPIFVDTSTVIGAVPPGVAGLVDVVVSNVNGSDSLVGAFTYQDPVTAYYDSGKNNRTVVLAADPAGGMWMGLDASWDYDVEGGGLIYYDDGGTPTDPTDDSLESYGLDEGLPSLNIYAIEPDGANGIWIATGSWWCYCGEMGLTYLAHNGTPLDSSDDQVITFDTLNSGLPDDWVTGIEFDTFSPVVGGMWLATYERGLVYFIHNGTPLDDTDDQWYVRDSSGSPGLWTDRLTSVEFVSPYLRIGYDTNRYKYLDFDNTTPYDSSLDIWGNLLDMMAMPEFFSSVAPGVWWIAGRYWGLEYHDEAGTPLVSDESYTDYYQSDGLISERIHGLSADATGVWIAEEGGLSHLDPAGTPMVKTDDTWTTFLEADGLSNQNIFAILDDTATSFWLGTERGLSHFDHANTPGTKTDDTWSTIYFELPGEPRDVQADPNGGVWIATEYGLAYVGDGGTPTDPWDDSWTYFSTADGLASSWVTSVLPNPNGQGIWIVGQDTVYLDHNGTPSNKADDAIVTLSPPFAPSEDSYEGSRMFLSPSGTIWIATEQYGALYYDHATTPTVPADDAWLAYSSSDGLPSNYVTDMSFDPPDGIWFATIGGALYLDTRGTPLVKIDDLKTVFTAVDSGLADTVTASVLVDPSGAGVWFGTLNGLSFLDHQGTPSVKVDDQWMTYTTGDGMLSNFVWRMHAGSRGLIWFTFSDQFGSGVDGIAFLNHSGTPKNKSDDFWGRIDSTDGLDVTYVENAIMAETTGGYWVGGRDWPVSVFYFLTR